jgi:hypothetical protein
MGEKAGHPFRGNQWGKGKGQGRITEKTGSYEAAKKNPNFDRSHQLDAVKRGLMSKDQGADSTRARQAVKTSRWKDEGADEHAKGALAKMSSAEIKKAHEEAAQPHVFNEVTWRHDRSGRLYWDDPGSYKGGPKGTIAGRRSDLYKK